CPDENLKKKKGALKSETCANSLSASILRLARRNCIPLALLVLSLLVFFFWNCRQTNHLALRRLFSFANANDFSWRNRVTSWEGALQITVERPWLGIGWDEPTTIYKQFYRPPVLDEGLAIILNDYLMLGMILGVPAMLCFLGYIWVSLVGRESRTENYLMGPF